MQRRNYLLFIIVLAVATLLLAGCGARKAGAPVGASIPAAPMVDEVSGYKKIHVFVALCDNANQGIQPVPAGIGNGQDAASNLYWGTDGGMKTYFKKSSDWKMIEAIANPKAHILERVTFQHKTKKALIVADAYDGAYIKQAIGDMITASSGHAVEMVPIAGKKYVFGGGADMIGYVGHDGLMEFQLDINIEPATGKKKDVVILSCTSNKYFRPYIQKANANPLLWTKSLMCPEVYTLKVAIDGWLVGDTPANIMESAAKVYSKYQGCSVRGARTVFATGF